MAWDIIAVLGLVSISVAAFVIWFVLMIKDEFRENR